MGSGGGGTKRSKREKKEKKRLKKLRKAMLSSALIPPDMEARLMAAIAAANSGKQGNLLQEKVAKRRERKTPEASALEHRKRLQEDIDRRERTTAILMGRLESLELKRANLERAILEEKRKKKE